MSVKSKCDDKKLTLELDNGDYTEFKKALDKWSFKDEQSLMRFAISLLILNENKYFSVKIDDRQQDIVPAADLLKGNV